MSVLVKNVKAPSSFASVPEIPYMAALSNKILLEGLSATKEIPGPNPDAGVPLVDWVSVKTFTPAFVVALSLTICNLVSGLVVPIPMLPLFKRVKF